MKIKWINLVLKFVLIAIVLTGCIGLYYFTEVINNTKIIRAQELTNKRILLYEYNNVKNESIGENKYKFTMEMATPYRVYEKGDTLINESSHGSIKWKINGKDNYKINKIESGAAFEETYDIDSDSFEVEYFIDDDIEMQLDDDTTKFIKNGRVIYRNAGMTIFNDGVKLNKTKTKLWKNKLKVKFNRSDKSKKANVDPTWTWQPDAATGYDTYLNSTSVTSNYATATAIGVGDASSTGNRADRILLKFNLGGLPSGVTITSVTVSMYEYTALDEGAVGTWAVTMQRLLKDWVENEATWNVYSTGNNWTTAGAGSDGNDRSATISASVTLDGTAAEDFIDWTSDNLVTDIQNFKDGVWSNYGWIIHAADAEDQGTDRVKNAFRSSDYATAEQRIKIVVDYTLNLTLSLSTLSDSTIECTVDTTGTGLIDSFVIMLASDSSVMNDVFYTLIDTLDTLSINTNYSLIAGGYVEDTLKYFSFPESLYTLAAVPDSPFVQSWNTTNLRIHPIRGENPSNTKFAIYDSTLQRYINSSGDTVSSAVWQTEAVWDSVIVIDRSPNTEYTFGVFAKNGDNVITEISDLGSSKTNSYIDSIKVSANSDSSYIVYFGEDTVYSPFVGYCVIDDSDSSVVSDTLRVFSYGMKSIITDKPFTLNTLNKLRVMRIENPADSFYYSEKDSAYTLTAKPTAPVISGTSDSTFLLQFDDVSGNPDSIEYVVFDSAYLMFRNTSGDTTSTPMFTVDTLWNNTVMKTYSPNLLISIGVFGKNDGSVFSEVSSDTTWVWAAVPGSTLVSIVDSATVLLKINRNGNPDYTYFAVEDSISGKFIDVSTKSLRASGVTVDSTWAFGIFSDWGGSDGVLINVTPKTNYYFRAYSKDGNRK